ncbi:MAG: hypothetical protein IJH68_02775 [Thermoguttaceae bacterium]|nr:hypothetical protein [Thermoguttaceae bacterium]
MRHLRAFLGLLWVLALLAPAAARETISLDGTWRFATDGEQIGEAQNWFAPGAPMAAMPLAGYAPWADGTIQVPGIWDQQGYGVDTEKIKHHFVGFGWYKKSVDIPASWEGNDIFLVLGGISRQARVWVNGARAGKDLVGPVGSFTVDITDLVRYGEENDITIRVDSHQHWEVDAILGSSSLNDYMKIEWGGLWGHVSIEARPKQRIEDLYLMTDLAESSCTAQADLIGKTNADAVKIEVFDAEGEPVAEGVSKITSDERVSASAVIDSPKLWSPDTPYLYTVRLSLMAGETVLDTLESRYGMRRFTAEGNRLLLNGKPIYLTGYGDDHIYPYEYSMPTNKQMYLARIAIIKSFGFNHVRNHSAILPHEYYEACDEMGIIPTGEFPIGYPQQLPGNKWWEASVPEGTPHEPVYDTYRERFAQVVREYRNHPCILIWIMGNELWGGMSIRHDFQKIAKTLDPQRFFSDSDGEVSHYFQSDEYVIGTYWMTENKPITKKGRDRDTLDLGFVMFNEGATPLLPGKFAARDFPKPIISHEAGNYITFSRPDQIKLFDDGGFADNPSLAGAHLPLYCSYKPFWMTEGAAKLKELGISGEEVEQWARASEEMYYLHHKANVESMRLNPEITGYHWWLIQDYWTTSNGLVDLFFRPKSIAPERVRLFNAPLVLLQEGLDLSYEGGQTDEIKLFVSNYTAEPITGELVYTCRAADEENTERFAVDDLRPGELREIGVVNQTLPEAAEPTEMTIDAALVSGGETLKTNGWRAKIFPSAKNVVPEGKKVYADNDVLELFPGGGMEPIPADGPLSSDAVYVTGYIEPRLADALEKGAGVVLLDARSLFEGISINYQQTWWKGGDEENENHTGTYVYDTPMTRRLGIGEWCAQEWYYLLNGAAKFYLDRMPSRPNVEIRALPSLVRVQDTAVLFDAAVGQGTLVASGLNHAGAKDRPENRAVLKAMIRCAAEEKPAVSWPREAVMPTVSLPEGTTLGFVRTLPSNFESSLWKSWKADDVRNLVCRQTSKENVLSWLTAPAPADAESVTFVFSGGLGYREQPETGGFALEVNGQEVLTFDLPPASALSKARGKTSVYRWTCDNGVTLSLEILRFTGQDTFGRFSLSVPRELLSGEAGGEKISVRSLGEGSRRWFAVVPMFDLTD